MAHMKPTILTAALVLAALTMPAPAHAIGGGPDPCQTTDRPAAVHRYDAPSGTRGPRVIIYAKVTHTTSVCSPLSGAWVITAQTADAYRMVNRDLGCRTATRHIDVLAGTRTRWTPTGRATSC